MFNEIDLSIEWICRVKIQEISYFQLMFLDSISQWDELPRKYFSQIARESIIYSWFLYDFLINVQLSVYSFIHWDGIFSQGKSRRMEFLCIAVATFINSHPPHPQLRSYQTTSYGMWLLELKIRQYSLCRIGIDPCIWYNFIWIRYFLGSKK